MKRSHELRLQAHPALYKADPEAEIADLRAYPLQEPVSGRRYTVIRLRTKSGLEGYGECSGVTAAELARARETLSGKPATAFEVIRPQLAALPGVQAAVNMALLDIVGKIARAPVYQVLGGPTRHKARALAALAGDSDAALIESFSRARQAGFDGEPGAGGLRSARRARGPSGVRCRSGAAGGVDGDSWRRMARGGLGPGGA